MSILNGELCDHTWDLCIDARRKNASRKTRNGNLRWLGAFGTCATGALAMLFWTCKIGMGGATLQKKNNAFWKASTALMDLKNGTAGVELPKRVFSAMEHVCYHSTVSGACALPIVCMDGCTHACICFGAGVWTNGHFRQGLNKETHNVYPGGLVCCEQQ